MTIHLGYPLDPSIPVWGGNLFGANPANYAKFGNAGHEGLDFLCDKGTPVYACADGTVNFASNDSGPYGLHVIIDHVIDSKKVQTFYCHLSALTCKVGDKVKQGDTIGKVGDTGNADGYHLHLTVKIEGEQTPGYPAGVVDPLPLLDYQAKAVGAVALNEKPLFYACPAYFLNVRTAPGVNADRVNYNGYNTLLPMGITVAVYEVKTVGTDTWARIGTNMWSALHYSGEDYLVKVTG